MRKPSILTGFTLTSRKNAGKLGGWHARQCGQRDAADAVDQFINIRLAHQFALLLHQPQVQQFSLDLEMISVSLRAWRLPPLAPQVSQIGNAALVEE